MPGGTILRATGDLFIAGLISVGAQNFGGTFTIASVLSPGVWAGFRAPGAGISAAPASSGEFGSNATVRSGGNGGFRALGLVNTLGSHLLLGGGGGGPGEPRSTGRLGGGWLMIMAKGTITVASGALIEADGMESLDSSSAAGGGGEGGASAGGGGFGADALLNGSCVLGAHGDEGRAINIETDPTAMF